MRLSRRKTRILWLATVGLTLLLVGVAVSVSAGIEHHPSSSRFPVCISEYVSSNTRYANREGLCCDYVELHNTSDAPIAIGGFHLTDKESELRYTVPAEVILEPHGYYVIYCCKGLGSEYADFALSREGGETLTLMNRRNVRLDSTVTVALQENHAAVREESGAWSVAAYGTPGFENSEKGFAAYQSTRTEANSGLCISEVLSGNSIYYNEDGRLCDFVELYNRTDAPLRLGGYMLTDSEQDIRFRFPKDAILEPHGYYVVWCSREYVGERYADFSVSRGGGEELLLLTPDRQTADRFATVAAAKNCAMIRNAENAVQVIPYATPGQPNTPEGNRAALAALSDGTSPLEISEVLTRNTTLADPNGRLSDYIEIHNRSDRTVDLSLYGLSDRPGSQRYRFAQGTELLPGACLPVYCLSEGGEGYAPFGLSGDGGELLLLTDAQGRCLDAVLTVAAADNEPLLRQTDGSLAAGGPLSPGYENTPAGVLAYQSVANASAALRISEFLPANGATLADCDGAMSDYVELINAGSEPLPLADFYLTDDPAEPYRYRLPEMRLPVGGRLLVFCSGKTDHGGELHAPFRLSSADGTVALYSRYGVCLDQKSYQSAQKDYAFAVDADGTLRETAYPTPGYENTPEGYRAYLADRIPTADLILSEVAPTNRSALPQRGKAFSLRGGEYFDFVEIVNRSDHKLNIGGYRLTDALDAPDRCILPELTLQSGETFLIFCSGDPELTDEKAFHANLRLGSGSETVFLLDADGKLLDYMRLIDVPVDGSMIRDKNGALGCIEGHSPNRFGEEGLTPGIPSEKPTASLAPGIYEGARKLSLTLSGPGAIYYTTDCTLPTEASARFTAPLSIDKTTVVRAVCIEPNKAPSEVYTLSYIVNEGHTLPVVSVVAEPEALYGETGIYSNPLTNWERPGCVSLLEPDGGGFTLDCGLRISGQTSRRREHKSFRFVFRDSYAGRLRYPVFPNYRIESFSSLLLRSGLDGQYAVIREPFFTRLAMPYKDTTLVQCMRMAVAYVNGEYFGLYIIAEAYNEDFYADWFEIPAGDVTLAEKYLYEPDHELRKLMDYATRHDLSEETHFSYLAERIDLDSLIDWSIFEAYYHNTDISGNIRYFKSPQTGGKWQFALYDVECGMSFSMDINPPAFNCVTGNGQTRDLFVPLMKNPTFRDSFFRRLAYHCEVSFAREHVRAVLDELVAEIENEVPRNTARWDYEPDYFALNIGRLRQLVSDIDRPRLLIEDAVQRFRMTDAEKDRYFGEYLHG